MSNLCKRKKTTRTITLTSEAFRSLVQLTSKTMAEMASFDARLDHPKELRQKYDGLYKRLVELFAKESLDKDDKEMQATLSFGLSIKDFDFITGRISFGYSRINNTVQTDYTLIVFQEHAPYPEIAVFHADELEKESIRENYQLI